MTETNTKVEPKGHEHVVGIDEVFFSTTDRKGIIELANSIFVRLSHYDHDELVGAPHNIIRHPDMPGGAFKHVWDQLESGKTACAYVKNLAKDGGLYWVFATIMPVGDKYLSVRMSPCVAALKDASDGLYNAVRPEELKAREDGASRDQAATTGAALITEGLAGLGIPDFDALALAALPAEVSAHEEQGSGLPWRPDASGPLATLLETMHAIDADTTDLVLRLAEYDEVATQVQQANAAAGPTLDQLNGLLAPATEGAAAVGEDMPELTAAAEAMTARTERAGTLLAEVTERLTALQASIRRLRFRISMLRLHNVQVGRFSAELIDGASTPDAGDSIRLLCTALGEGATRLGEDIEQTHSALLAISDQIYPAVKEVDGFRRQLGKWRRSVTDSEQAGPLSEQLHRIEEQAKAGFGQVDSLADVAARCRYLDLPFDRARTEESLRIMTAAAAEI